MGAQSQGTCEQRGPKVSEPGEYEILPAAFCPGLLSCFYISLYKKCSFLGDFLSYEIAACDSLIHGGNLEKGCSFFQDRHDCKTSSLIHLSVSS
jgi:hypothetical protein